MLALLLHTKGGAQQYYMKGEVRDEGGNPLQNVSIVLQSTGYVYYSGVTGSFGIITNKVYDTLLLSLSGYENAIGVANASGYINITLKKKADSNNDRSYKLSSFTKNLRRETQQQWFAGDETYASIIENQFINAASYPTTGLALNVDRASYTNIRRFLNMNALVPPDAVRIEEMLNYFNFNYAEPKDSATFTINATLTSCPWNKTNQLLFTTIHSKKVNLDSLPPSNLVFLIDVSGSMDMPNRLPLLKAGFRGLVTNLRAVDSVSIVVYGGTVGVMLDATSGIEKDKIFKVIDSLTPGGSTPGESGVKLAYSVARNHFIKEGNNRVILATDGDFNVGLRTEEELQELISVQRESGIYLTCLGVGMGNYKDSKIQALAQKGNGNFAYIDSYAEAEKVLLKEFTQTLYTVADNVYLNAVFDPLYVKEYRLIGFGNKVGAIKDTAATIEGGEIGSGYSMIALFELIPVASIEKDKMITPVSFTLQYKIPDNKQQCE
ncbi:MAG TPA: von Willebrand factor type A domain-containing protein, partial [Chitinophagaceae bacterium]|nr:von Willebrand factor type A domain-containing protein [Chitinophagaceae bacterium]